jgi:hypothetical protein
MNYGRQSDTAGRAVLLTRFSLTGDQGSNPWPSADMKRSAASMVKWISPPASNGTFQVRVLVEAIKDRTTSWCSWCSGSARRPVTPKVTVQSRSNTLHTSDAPGRASSLQNCRMGFESSRSCLLPTWLTQKSAGLVNRSMLVRIQPSALSRCRLLMV